MADEPDKSWWTTLPGILTATAAVITAATGLVAVLSQTGVFGEKSKAFVGQKASDVKEAVVASPSSSSSSSGKADGLPASPAVSATSSKSGSDITAGIATTPLHAEPFTGAIVTLRDKTTVKLRDDVKEYCQGRPQFVTLNGQTVEWSRLKRIDVIDWNANDQRGSVHVTLNNGEAMDLNVKGCFVAGSNDLGAYSGPFENIRSVEFIR